MWGGGDFERLGHGDEADQLAPKRVEALQDEWAVAVFSGSYHTIVVTRDGGVFSWGGVGGLGLPEAPVRAAQRSGLRTEDGDGAWGVGAWADARIRPRRYQYPLRIKKLTVPPL